MKPGLPSTVVGRSEAGKGSGQKMTELDGGPGLRVAGSQGPMDSETWGRCRPVFISIMHQCAWVAPAVRER